MHEMRPAAVALYDLLGGRGKTGWFCRGERFVSKSEMGSVNYMEQRVEEEKGTMCAGRCWNYRAGGPTKRIGDWHGSSD